MPPPPGLTISLDPEEEDEPTSMVTYKVNNLGNNTFETVTKKAKVGKPITTEYIIQNFNSVKDEFFQYENMEDPLIQNLKRGMETTFAYLISRLDDKENLPVRMQDDNLKYNRDIINHEIQIKGEKGEFNEFSDQKKVLNAYSLGVSVTKSRNRIFKKILLDLADPNILFKLILEVRMQMLGLQIAKAKGIDIIIPEIHSFSLYEGTHERAERSAVFEFSMDYVPIIDVKLEKNKRELIRNCDSLIEKIKGVFEEFEESGLFHNDSHHDNLCFMRSPTGELQLVLLDFGKASLHKFGNQSTTSFYKEIMCDGKFEDWLNGLSGDIYSKLHFYGGKTKRKRKRGRKSLRRKRV